MLALILMGPIKDYPSLYHYCLSTWVLPFCWVALLSCYTLGYGGSNEQQ